MHTDLEEQDRAEVTQFIEAFAGSHHFILDYLIEEVLLRQPEPIRDFLLQTAILDKLCGPLCDAVMDQTESKRMLKELERGNLFLIPLDDKREWYRYHHLFADVLKAHLMEDPSKQLPTLHLRASEWYQQNEMPVEAINHAFAAEDFERVAELIELIRPSMENSYETAVWLGWVKRLPNELLLVRPVLSAGYAWALLDRGEMEPSEARLQDAERWLDDTSSPNAETSKTEMIVADKEEFQVLPASIAVARAYRSLAYGDVPHTILYAQQAINLLPEGSESQWHGAAMSLLGLAQLVSGELEAADLALTDFMMSKWETDSISDVISVSFIIAEIKISLGRLQETSKMYQHVLQLAVRRGEPFPLGTADLYRGISELNREQGDIELAEQQLLKAEALGKQLALPDWHYRLFVSQAHLKELGGDYDGALLLLDEAEKQHIRTPVPVVRPVPALRARVWIKQGKLDAVRAWAHEQALAADDELNYLREFEHITLASALIAQYRQDPMDYLIEEAMTLLERLLLAAEAGKRTGSVITLLVLQAMAYQVQHMIPVALASLGRALTLAEPQGYIQVFVGEGAVMAQLLSMLLDENSQQKAYIQKLLNVINKTELTDSSTTPAQPLLDPLSERELEVLKLLSTEMSGPEIARELVVSLNTMRTHTKNIYSKLGVNNRRTAVRRAEELRLL